MSPADQGRTPRNLIICFDGTNNQFGSENTSVVRLVQVLDRDPDRQRLYYDPGVGTLPEPGFVTGFGKRISEWIGLAFGSGLTANVAEAYSYLMDFWEQGDQVYLFGFSRGAYTARVLAGLLHSLGLLPRGNQNLVPYVMRLFGSVRGEAGRNGTDAKSAYWKLCDDFRWTFSRQLHDHDDERRFRVHFLGVWDTVSSVGWIWDPKRYPFTAHNPSIDVIRHAIAVDERRWFYRQNRMFPADPAQDFDEQWFAGVHSDVGGGYDEKEGGLWRPPFEWVLGEAQRAGLAVDAGRLDAVRRQSGLPASPWTEPQHESLKGLWWLAECFPKRSHARDPALRKLRLGLGRHRSIEPGARISRSTLLRIRDGGARVGDGRSGPYAPPNLPKSFCERVQALPDVPEALVFER